MSNLFKGTKGKWYRSGTVVVSAKDSFEIADVWAANELPHHEWTEDHNQEAEANAQLMASAPELLNAALFAWVLLSDIPEEAMDGFTKKATTKLSVAISKALNIESEGDNE